MATDLTTSIVLREDVLEWTSLERVKDRLVATASSRVAMPAEDAAAAVQEGGAPAKTAADVVRETCAGIGGVVTAGVPSRHVLARVMDFPTTDAAEVAGMVELQVDKFSPFPVDGMVVAHEVLRQTDAATRVLVAAVREKVVDELGERLAPSRIKLARVDAAVLGWWRLLDDAHELAGEGRKVVVILDRPACEVLVFQDGIPLAVRSLGTTAGLSDGDLTAELAAEVPATLMSLELEHGVAEHCSVTVWHRDDMPADLARALRDASGCAVTDKSLGGLPPVSEGLARRQAAPRGTLLDLTPPAWRAADRARLFKRKMVLAAVAVFGVWAIGIGGLLGGLTVQNLRLSRLKAQAAEWHKPALEVRDLRRRVGAIEQYTDRRTSAMECLREISSRLPATGMDLSLFSYRKDDVLKITGEAGTVAEVYEFKKAIDESDIFAGSALQGPHFDPRLKKQIFDMDIKLATKGNG